MIILIYNNSLSFLQEINNEFLKVSAGFSIFGTIKDHKREWRGSIFLLGRGGGDFVGNGNSFQKLDSVAFFEKVTESNFWKEFPLFHQGSSAHSPICAQKRLCSVDRTNVQKKNPTVLKMDRFQPNLGPKVYTLCSRNLLKGFL